MRKILLFALFLSSLLWNAAAHAQERCVEVTLTEAGTLEEALAGKADHIQFLYVSGPMNRKDCKYFSTMYAKWGILSYVNLTKATFENDALPDSAFVGAKSVTEVRLPDYLKKIGYDAFAGTEVTIQPIEDNQVCQ